MTRWIFSVRFCTEAVNARTLERRAVVGPASVATVEAALCLTTLSEGERAEIRGHAMVRKFVEGILDPTDGYYVSNPFNSASRWLVCIGSVQEVIA